MSFIASLRENKQVLVASCAVIGVSAAGLTRKAAWFKVSKRREMDISTVAGALRGPSSTKAMRGPSAPSG